MVLNRAKIVFSLLSCVLLGSVYCRTLVPCYFIFGDSLLDNGNNNDRKTFAKANYPPYGNDFPGGPTGRFTNGRNVADFIAEYLGFKDHIPPFANASGKAILNGVNYASGGAGILSTTGKEIWGDVISMEDQLQNHKTTISRTKQILGSADAANKHLSQCIYSVGMGSNDYGGYARSKVKPSPQRFAQTLIDQYSRQLRALYSSGARKVAVFGLGTIGCIPLQLKGTGYGPTCLSATKLTAGVFNDKVKALVDVLNKELVGSKFIFIDIFGITSSDPSINGLQNTNQACCSVTAAGMCAVGGQTCSSTAAYEYFDGYHPTEATNMAVAKRAFTAKSPSDAYPCDIQILAQAH